MRKTDIKLNDRLLTATFEFIEGELKTNDYPGTNPTVRLWSVTDVNDNDITDTINSNEWLEIENLCYEAES